MTSKRRFKFTTASIAKRALSPEPDSKAKDILYFDTKTTGFGIRVGRARPGGGRGAAHHHEEGRGPERRAEEAHAVTLREAVERHLEVMRINRRQPRSIKGLEDDAERCEHSGPSSAALRSSTRRCPPARPSL